MLIGAQEMARYVCEGVLDAGLTGLDCDRRHRYDRDGDTCVTEPRRSGLLEQSFGKVSGSRRAEDSRFKRRRISRRRSSPPSSCRVTNSTSSGWASR